MPITPASGGRLEASLMGSPGKCLNLDVFFLTGFLVNSALALCGFTIRESNVRLIVEILGPMYVLIFVRVCACLLIIRACGLFDHHTTPPHQKGVAGTIQAFSQCKRGMRLRSSGRHFDLASAPSAPRYRGAQGVASAVQLHSVAALCRLSRCYVFV